MNELIPIKYENDRPAVSARELHEFLEVKTDFPHWFDRMKEYGFADGEDYQTFLSDRIDGKAGKPRNDAVLTLDMAKELCMIQRTERGKQARQYFLQIEKNWNSPEYEKYQHGGYTKSDTPKFVRQDGTIGCALHTRWTQKGRLFLYELLKKDGILPLIEKDSKAA